MTNRPIKIGDFLLRRKDAFVIQDDQFYKRVTIKIKRNGISMRDKVLGMEIGTKKQFYIKEGQFLISKIDARNGAFGIVPTEVNKGIITGNFWTFDIDENIVDRDYFLSFISTNAFDEICEKTSSGTTNRKYLDEKKFLKFEIQIPATIEEQRGLVKTYLESQKNFLALKMLSDKNEKLIKSLKASILQDAIQGKLVPQDPSDEPASILIEKIQIEKEKLIAEGKIKKQKSFSAIKSAEIPYELPKGWEWVKLGEIGESFIGLTYSPLDAGNKGIPVLRSNNIKNNKIVFSDLIRVNKEINQKLLVNKGDLLICSRNGSKNLVGKSAIIPEYEGGLSFGAFMAIFRSKCNRYIDSFMQTNFYRKQLFDSNTITINQITQSTLLNIVMPLPPFQEQLRIVEKIDELMKSCELLDEQVKQAKERSEKLMESVLQGVFNG